MWRGEEKGIANGEREKGGMRIAGSKFAFPPSFLVFRQRTHARLVSNFWHRTILANTFARSFGRSEREREREFIFPLPFARKGQKTMEWGVQTKDTRRPPFPFPPLLAHNTPPKDMKGTSYMPFFRPSANMTCQINLFRGLEMKASLLRPVLLIA